MSSHNAIFNNRYEAMSLFFDVLSLHVHCALFASLAIDTIACRCFFSSYQLIQLFDPTDRGQQTESKRLEQQTKKSSW
jgi:hypothetical protein